MKNNNLTIWNKNNLDQIKQIKTIKLKDKLYYPSYHMSAYSGLINDPVGLAYINNKYLIGYQWYPFGPVHGLKHWGLIETSDLINLTMYRKPIIIPDNEHEKTGSYSGSAIIKDGKLYIIYTGDHKNIKGLRTETIMLKKYFADNNNDIDYGDKIKLFDSNDASIKKSTGHFRDPFIYVYQNQWYCLVGSQAKNLKGFISVWKSNALDQNWLEMGRLKIKYAPKNSYMYECPNINYNQKHGLGIFIYCAQGLKSNPQHQVFFQLFSDPDISQGILKVISKPKRLDYGFDFYAPQIFYNQPNTFVAWLGMAESDNYYSNKYLWANCLTMLRKYKYVDHNKIVIYPHKYIYSLVESVNHNYDHSLHRASFIKIKPQNFSLKISNEKNQFIELTYQEGKIYFSRKNQTHPNPATYGNEVEVFCKKYSHVEIFIDHSTIEIFFIGSDVTITSRFLLDGNLKLITQQKVKVYNMKGLQIIEK